MTDVFLTEDELYEMIVQLRNSGSGDSNDIQDFERALNSILNSRNTKVVETIDMCKIKS